jgi:hypothetical protein
MTGDWVYMILGLLVALGGLLLMAWALFADGSRGRRRCPKCWYNMAGTDTFRCPECGYEAEGERNLLKSRRRVSWALVGGAVIVAGVGCGLLARMSEATLARLIPTPILVRIAPLDQQAWGAAATPRLAGGGQRPADVYLAELVDRCQKRELSLRTWEILFRRFFEAYPEEVELLAKTRKQWPQVIPEQITLLPDDLLGHHDDIVLRTRPQIQQGIWHVRPCRERPEELLLRYDYAPDDLRNVGFDIELAIDGTVVWSGISPPITISVRGFDVQQPISSPALDARLLSELQPTVRIGSPVRPLRISLLNRDQRWGRDVTYPLLIDVVAGDEVAGLSYELCRMPPPGVIMYSNFGSWERHVEIRWERGVIHEPGICDEPWQIRIRTHVALAGQDLNSGLYWLGDIRLPVDEDIVARWASVIQEQARSFPIGGSDESEGSE